MFKKLGIILEMIKFEHTLFALPFAFLGAILGNVVEEHSFPTIMEWVWITLAMVGARSAAMTLNRVIDARIDKENPRTATRAIPAKLISSSEAILFIVGSFALLLFSAWKLNPLSMYLLPIAVFFLVIYSYTKRFTYLCHVVLGITIALAPLGGWVGATGTLSWEAFLLYVAVLFWTAGFDVIYATQDADYDRGKGLYSIPSYFGVGKALMIARGFHVVSFLGFIALGVLASFGWIYFVGVLISGAIMIYEHSLVSANDLSKLNVAFFTMNGILSVVMFVFSLGDLLL
ncbi:4-hydroxybenzoate octaprenyltransferase [Fictibacillus macauensis ZFHKF-1]|uniref:4-hydroxybenzoate polyprenyltransferase n=1 Tax=Fictibacillus macauensis ZFHKF-1 TaxID=1196324 RepID=I8UIE1_9BACL|nr:UbiA-like polyprenyltransferase [Fictibacillus macauensis]EIT86588.1 4-hydroxybenzoate octaprenyltransferase [Fictibacillus macauensis ZFHKF-1]